MILADFHADGIFAYLIERLKMVVRKVIPAWPRCLRWCIVSPSGPAAVELPDDFIALATSASVKDGAS